MHVDENFAHLSVFIFTGTQIYLVAANGCFLGVTLAAFRKLTALLRDKAFDDTFRDNLRLTLLLQACFFFFVFHIILSGF